MKNYKNDTNHDKQAPFSIHHAMHIILLLAVVISIALLIWKFSNWGTYVDINNLEDNPDDKYQMGMDEIFPLFTGTDDAINDDGVTNILVFGNHPFSDDRDSKDSLANIIAEKADATVYNCAVSGSCLSAQTLAFTPDFPMDAYSFYWLVTLAVSGANSSYYPQALQALGEDAPLEAEEVYDTLTSLDLNTIDVAVIMYDATDYLKWHNLYNEENSTDITCFAGGLEAGIELLQSNYPNIRIIVMSPTYAYYVAKDGEYISSDVYLVHGEYGLSSYLGKQAESSFMRSVTFVDNLYGSITEENAKDYLTDNLHLNVEGRKVVADHFIYALNYFDKQEKE